MKDKKDFNFNDTDEELDLWELLSVIFDGKWIIASITILFSVGIVFYSLSLPNIYQSKAILVPVEFSKSLSNNLNAYSGLANLAGISLSSGGGDSNSEKAVEKLNTLSFFENNIIPNIYLPELMAVESWDRANNKLLFNPNIYDEVNKKWVRKYDYPQKQKPTAQESFRRFKSNMSIVEDSKNGFITVSIKHQSPYIAKKWTELIINQVNNFYKEKDKLEAEKALIYLNNQIDKTSLTEIKQVIAGLLQQETQKLTLIEASESYVFEYIDPPAVMEMKVGPRRSLICIIGAIVGGLFSIMIVLLKHYLFLFRKK